MSIANFDDKIKEFYFRRIQRLINDIHKSSSVYPCQQKEFYLIVLQVLRMLLKKLN